MEDDVGAGDLAELLRELKERSGLSYGVLAKRLHVSTSTLHRYVNGTAVPTEFAPLERLARLCKAGPEELMEVHRRWIVADATRGSRKAEPQAEARPAAPEASAGSEASAGPGAPAGAPAEAPAPASGTARSQPPSEQGPRPGPGPEPESPPAPEPERAPASAPEPTPAPQAAPEPHATPRTRPRTGPGSGLRLPRRKRQRLVVLAAVGVVLALGGTALAVHGASDGSGGDGKNAAADHGPRTGTERRPSATGEGDPSGKPSTTASTGPSKDKGKAADKEAGKDGGAAKGPGNGRGGEGSEGRAPGSHGQGEAPGSASGRAPVTVSAQSQYWDSPCGYPYLINRPPDRLPTPPGEQDAESWVSAFGAVAAGEQGVKFTVQGTGEDTVVLNSLSVRVVGRAAPPDWNSYDMGFIGAGCGGGVAKHVFDVRLDNGQPALVPQGGDSFPFTVSESDVEAFYVFARAKTKDVRWYLELEWSSGDRHGTVVIDDKGEPFRTSAAPDNPTYGWSIDKRKWVKMRRDANGSEHEADE
ncbi:helix-turn-helix transcriptional regulator [Streptomyces longispororuber]|uniref:helix-turn-helix domain-containing protein n=1 Tax=Streptomyces longispororuber TaxID=68230 RepID=UPI003404770B